MSSEQIKRYCKAHKTAVKIDRMSGFTGSQAILSICEHTGNPNVFSCNLKCVYAQGAQTAAMIGVQQKKVHLNSDGTLPIDTLKLIGFDDYTSEIPKDSMDEISEKTGGVF